MYSGDEDAAKWSAATRCMVYERKTLERMTWWQPKRLILTPTQGQILAVILDGMIAYRTYLPEKVRTTQPPYSLAGGYLETFTASAHTWAKSGRTIRSTYPVKRAVVEFRRGHSFPITNQFVEGVRGVPEVIFSGDPRQGRHISWYHGVLEDGERRAVDYVADHLTHAGSVVRTGGYTWVAEAGQWRRTPTT